MQSVSEPVMVLPELHALALQEPPENTWSAWQTCWPVAVSAQTRNLLLIDDEREVKRIANHSRLRVILQPAWQV